MCSPYLYAGLKAIIYIPKIEIVFVDKHESKHIWIEEVHYNDDGKNGDISQFAG